MDLRAPFDPAVVEPGSGPWRIEAVAETASTNADLLRVAAQTPRAPEGLVRVAEFQNAGRGRLDREWVCPPGAGLMFSMLLRPTPSPATWGWLPLLAGLSLVEAIGADARLKWPNDLLLGPDGAKAAGILVQSVDGCVVAGMGINVTNTREELPHPASTSLQLLQRGDVVNRERLLGRILEAFWARYTAWTQADGDAEAAGVAAEYRRHCATIGEPVAVSLPSGELTGTAVGIDASGQLLVRPASSMTTLAIAAGDITHLRVISR